MNFAPLATVQVATNCEDLFLVVSNNIITILCLRGPVSHCVTCTLRTRCCVGCTIKSVPFLAVDHGGSYHYFNVICLKQGEQVRS